MELALPSFQRRRAETAVFHAPHVPCTTYRLGSTPLSFPTYLFLNTYPPSYEKNDVLHVQMEYVDGIDLGAVIKEQVGELRRVTLELSDAAAWAAQSSTCLIILLSAVLATATAQRNCRW